MREYKFSIKKHGSVYEITDADENQHFFEDDSYVSTPMVLPLGALVSFYRKLANFCYEECIGGNSIYGNQRDIPWMYAVLRDKQCKKEAGEHLFSFGKNERNSKLYDVWHLILDGPTVRYCFERDALNALCWQINHILREVDDPRIKIWADYVLNKMTEDVPLDFEAFTKWVYYVHPDTPHCYYEVPFDAWDNVDDHLTLRQNVDIAAAYIKDHEHDYD